MALAITRSELSAADLRGEARRAKDGDQARRLLALALVLDGATPDGGGPQRRHGPSDAARLGDPL